MYQNVAGGAHFATLDLWQRCRPDVPVARVLPAVTIPNVRHVVPPHPAPAVLDETQQPVASSCWRERGLIIVFYFRSGRGEAGGVTWLRGQWLGKRGRSQPRIVRPIWDAFLTLLLHQKSCHSNSNKFVPKTYVQLWKG